jgi:hypothetical protein
MNPEAQSSNSVLLVRPAAFGFHADAAQSNAFATAGNDPDIALRAAREFDGLGRALADAGVEVLILEDTPEPAKPDSVFPNNWLSLHGDGTMVIYPMATAARRLERNVRGVADLLTSSGFEVRRSIDLSAHEQAGRFLEGTGSLILDRPARRAYASLSARTDTQVIAEFDHALGYSTLTVDAYDQAGRPIYHTNVLMSLGTEFAVLCGEVVADGDRAAVVDHIAASGRELIIVDYDQMRSFACNLIELRGADGEPLIALSAAARQSFEPAQLRTLERFGQLVDTPIPTIESVGGGSVRCMIAENHLPRG